LYLLKKNLKQKELSRKKKKDSLQKREFVAMNYIKRRIYILRQRLLQTRVPLTTPPAQAKRKRTQSPTQGLEADLKSTTQL